LPPTPAPKTWTLSDRVDGAVGIDIRFVERTSVLCVPLVSPLLKSRL
jgi:hypothetical protein